MTNALSLEFAAHRFPALIKLPATVFDAITALGIQSLNRRLVQQYQKPTGWLGRIIGQAMNCEHQPVTAWTLDRLNIGLSDSVLDIGCGAGMALSRARQYAKQGKVHGIDFSATMVEEAQRRNRNNAVTVQQADVCSQLPFAANSFDRVYSIETLYFWSAPQKGFAEILRVLRPGGRFAIALEYTIEGGHEELGKQAQIAIHSRESVLALFAGAGFTNMQGCYDAATHCLYVEGAKPLDSAAEATLCA